MRDAFVVLVSLFIRVATGFIVPSGIPEFLNEDVAILAENGDIQSEEMKGITLENNIRPTLLHFITKNPKKTLDFTNNKEYNDRGLYENANTKENNINERSFIIINHKYKTQKQNQLHYTQSRGENICLDKMQKNLTPNVNKFYVEESPLKFSAGYADYNTASSNRVHDEKKEEIYYPALNKYSQTTVNTKDKNLKTKTQSSDKQGNERREYFELLKRPMIRPSIAKSSNRNLKYNYIPDNKIEHSYNNLNKPSKHFDINKNQLPHKSTNILKNSYNASKYGYLLSDENKQSMFQHNNKFVKKYDDTDFNHKVISDDPLTVSKTSDNSLEEERQIDRYIVNNFEEQKKHENYNGNTGDCEYNCIEKLRKQYLENQILSKSQCRCSIDRIAREKSARDGSPKYKETITKSETDSNEYEEILAEVTNVTKKLNDQLI